MITVVATALLAFQTGAQPPTPAPADSSRPNSVTIGVRNQQTPRKVIPMTPALEASAFHDASARALIARARSARTRQDSMLQSYEATTRMRLSIGARLKAIGRDRLVYRLESARRIQWQRGVGAHIEVVGARQVAPVVSADVMAVDDVSMGTASIPYYPGRETLWPMGQLANAVTEGSLWVHPLTAGAEAYYRYATGDSIGFTLADKRTIRLTEIRLTPREPRWDLVAGSFWFDEASGQLVRAIYRPAVPMEMEMTMGARDKSSTFGWLSPLSVTVKSVSVEFSLQEGRWWLPIKQSAESEAQLTFVRVPAEMEQRFEYASVNAVPPLPAIIVDSAFVGRTLNETTLPGRSQAQRDSLAKLEEARRRARSDEEREAIDAARRAMLMSIRTEQCAANGGYIGATRRNDSVNVSVRISCDTTKLMASPALPASIFDPTDDPLSEDDVAMMARALGMQSQAVWSPARPTLHYGLDLLRYNRVEGLSVGAELRQQLGAGFTASLVGRLGVADLHPRGELELSRSDAFRTFTLRGYERLGVANDWGTPLDFAASLNALLFGRDEGLYYRATGAELAGRGLEGSMFSWRIFGEQHRTAEVETHFSLPHAFNGLRFRDNIVADRADLVGVGARLHASHGIDPDGFRVLGDGRVEGAVGDFDFARTMLDLTISRGLFGTLQGSLTAAGGTTRGDVPAQRLWYLGGVHTIRGQPLAAARGDAFWMGRGEVAYALPVVHPSVFYDLGWAGDRRDWRSPGVPISGGGIGLSVLDGLFRFDIAKGIRPNRGIRVDLSMEARF